MLARVRSGPRLVGVGSDLMSKESTRSDLKLSNPTQSVTELCNREQAIIHWPHQERVDVSSAWTAGKSRSVSRGLC